MAILSIERQINQNQHWIPPFWKLNKIKPCLLTKFIEIVLATYFGQVLIATQISQINQIKSTHMWEDWPTLL